MTQQLADNTSFRIHCGHCGNETFILWENMKTKDHLHCSFCGRILALAHLPTSGEYGESKLVVNFSDLELDDFLKYPDGDSHRLNTLEIESV